MGKEIMTESQTKLPKVPNDPAHPLRPYTFAWIMSSHVRGDGWAAHIYRDEFHDMRKIIRVPIGRKGNIMGLQTGTFYQFHGEDDELEYDAMIERMREQHGEYVDNIQNHPLVIAWNNGDEIPYTPSDPAFPVGSTVRLNWSDMPDDMHERMYYNKDERRGIVLRGNALYVYVDWGPIEQWQPVRVLELVPAES